MNDRDRVTGGGGTTDVTSLWDILREAWFVTAEMAPYLLLGFLVAGLLSVWISPRWLEAHVGGGGAGPVIKAALFGVPLPLCSCGVIPVGASARRGGASRAATASFLLATPQTGVDSIAVTYSILGPVVAVVRPLVALATGILGGLAVAAVEHEGAPARANRVPERPDRPRGSGKRVRTALAYGFGTLPADIGKQLLVGVAIAGLLAAAVPRDYLAAYLGGGTLSIFVLMAVGVPLYVCATASVPIAAGFIHLGVSPGAALAFLIAGPATNAAAITTIWRVLGRRTTAVYLLSVAISAVGGGLLLNLLLAGSPHAIPPLESDGHLAHGPAWWGQLAAIVLVGVILAALGRSRRRHPAEEPALTGPAVGRRIELDVAGMSCRHCSGSVQRALEDVPGVASADVDLASGRAVVDAANVGEEALTAAVRAVGFDARVVMHR
jgi:hypothetical protein